VIGLVGAISRRWTFDQSKSRTSKDFDFNEPDPAGSEKWNGLAHGNYSGNSFQ
jgi:hypothetical protein